MANYQDSAEAAVLSEILLAKLRPVVFGVRSPGTEATEWRKEWWAELEASMPRSVVSADGRVSAAVTGTEAEVKMAVALEESKRMNTPILYRSGMSRVSAARLARNTNDPTNVWYGCKVIREANGAGRIDVYVDATPIMPDQDGVVP